jgi:O-antigen/teichoic acid export membrane protein
VLIVRRVGASFSGIYFNELYIMNTIAFVFSFGLDYSAIAWVSRENALYQIIRKKLIQASIFFAFCLIVFISIFFNQIEFYLHQPWFGLCLMGVGNLMLILFQGLLTSIKKFNFQNLVMVVTNLTFLFFLYFFANPNHPYLIQIVSVGFGFLYFFQGIIFLISSNNKKHKTSSDINWRSFYKHGFFIMISSVIYFCFLRVDNFFVAEYCDVVTLSNYVQCGKIGQYFIYFSSIISSTLLPFVSTEKIGSDYNAWKKMITPYVLLICFAALILIVTGQIIYPLIFGTSFGEMYKLMFILIPGFVGLGLLTLINAIYINNGNIKKIFIGDFLGLCLVLSLDWLLIPKYGVYSAAIISSSAYLFVFLFLFFDLKNQFKKNEATKN